MTFEDALNAQRPVPGEPFFEQHLARYLHVEGRIPPGAKVLDAGCGVGYGAAILAGATREVVGVDASRTAIEYARRQYTGRAAFVVADVLKLPFPDATFDAVTCFEVLEHIKRQSQRELIAELARVLRSRGVLFLSTPNARLEAVDERTNGRPHWEYHIGCITPGELRQELKCCFASVRLYGQSPDLGIVHLVLKAGDVFGLRLRLRKTARARLQRVVQPIPQASQTRPYRFSRLVARSSMIVYAEAMR